MEFAKSPWMAVVLTIVGIAAGAVLGFLANQYFYGRGLEMRILEQDAEIRWLRSQKEALEKDLNKCVEENRTLRKECEAQEAKLGLKPKEQAIGPVPPQGLSVAITTVPTKGQGPETEENIGGQVVGLTRPETYKIVLYARTDRWYVQPYTSQPLTDVDKTGRWENSSHLGSEYAALLVKPTYSPPNAPEQLPPTGGDILAISRVPARSR
jgi:hypothetical protein